jgi:hypothetical protein
MIFPAIRSAAPSTRPALDLIALARLSPELARKKLRALLAANPDHFGNLSAGSFKAILKIEKDTTYESLAGLSYSPQSERLRAMIRIKKQTGYSAADSDQGSTEYVRFYISYDGGGAWLDQGMRALNIFDNTDATAQDPGVTLRIRPRELSSLQGFQRVRAILSWNSPPPVLNPNWTPIWGDVAEAEVRIAGSEFLIPEKLINTPDAELNHDGAAAESLIQEMEPLGRELPVLDAVEN